MWRSLDERLERLGEGLELQLITDQSRYISQSVSEVLTKRRSSVARSRSWSSCSFCGT